MGNGGGGAASGSDRSSVADAFRETNKDFASWYSGSSDRSSSSDHSPAPKEPPSDDREKKRVPGRRKVTPK